jgi:hypothetical protein
MSYRCNGCQDHNKFDQHFLGEQEIWTREVNCDIHVDDRVTHKVGQTQH